MIRNIHTEKLINKKIAFHIHTKYSYDSLLEPTEIVDYLAENGFELAIITDHNLIKGAIEAKEYAENKYGNKFEVIIGEEILTNIGDIIGFPIKNEISEFNFSKVIADIKKQNGFVCLPHPYKSHDISIIHNKNFYNDIDFIEIFNARCNENQNKNAINLRNNLSIKPIIGSDAHSKEELLNSYFAFDNDFSIINSYMKLSPKKYIRRSQKVKCIRDKRYVKALKYFFLSVINY